MTNTVPIYVYKKDHDTEPSLLQGDILKIDGQFRQYFDDFYPAIQPSSGKIEYVMILTQSCDLVRTEKRKPKLTHVNVCLVKRLNSVIKRLLRDEIKPVVNLHPKWTTKTHLYGPTKIVAKSYQTRCILS